MKVCEKCQIEYSDNKNFCRSCGNSLRQIEIKQKEIGDKNEVAEENSKLEVNGNINPSAVFQQEKLKKRRAATIGIIILFAIIPVLAFVIYLSNKEKAGNADKVEQVDTRESFADPRDGKKYKITKIGDQVWMAENLAYNTGNGCWAYADEEVNVAKFGRLYSWGAAMSACPEGWHLPQIAEWDQLAQTISTEKGPYSKNEHGWEMVGIHLKATNGWFRDGNGRDDYGFSSIPAGYRSHEGAYGENDRLSIYWSATERYPREKWVIDMKEYGSYLYMGDGFIERGFSVRCIKN